MLQTKAQRLFFFLIPKYNAIPRFSKTPKELKGRLGSRQALSSIDTNQTNPLHVKQTPKPHSFNILLHIKSCLYTAEM